MQKNQTGHNTLGECCEHGCCDWSGREDGLREEVLEMSALKLRAGGRGTSGLLSL